MADRSNLPAPYESPWRQLGLSLQAVAASLGLDLRALWRRNRSGDLQRPTWWPPALAALFWPLLLAAALTLLLVLARVGGQAFNHNTPDRQRPAPPLARAVEEAVAQDWPEQGSAGQSSAGQDAKVPVGIAVEPTPLPATTTDQPTIPPAAARAEPPPQADALLEAMGQGDKPNWLLAVVSKADQGLLILQVEPGFSSLEPGRQLRQADIWLERSRALAFERLELRSTTGALLGYQARVGSGMILLSSETRS